jgi:hypothetical protein
VLAWIISRDRDMVEHMASDGRSKPSAKWAEKDWPTKASEAEARGANPVYRDKDTALAALVYKGATGLISAEGCVWNGRSADPHSRIHAHYWGVGYALIEWVLLTDSDLAWIWVLIDRASVQRQWPDPDTASVSTETAPASKEEDKREPPPIELLAEWIYQRHVAKRGKYEQKAEILEAAQSERELPKFTNQQFHEAYRLVFASEAHKPPASGWPLNPTYQKRFDADMTSDTK